MPTKPLSHSQRQKQQRDKQADDLARQERQTVPAFVQIDHIRSSARWQKVRAIVLAKAPLCADPFDAHRQRRHTVPATQVDHIVPLRMQPDLAYDENNLQPLCASCHNRKTAQEGKPDG